MDILYHHRIASKDGQFVHVEEIVRALRAQGHHIDIVSPEMAEKEEFGHDGGFVTKLKQHLPKALYELLELGYGAIIAKKLWSAIRRRRPDVIYERYNLYQPVGVLMAKLFKIPLILEVNAPLKQERERFCGGLGLPKLAKWLENWTWRNADMVMPVSQVLAEHVLAAGVPKERIAVTHNGVRETLLEKGQSLVRPEEGPIVVGFVGFMHLTCGVDLAFEAMVEDPSIDAKLVCVGDGDILPALKQRAAELGVEDKIEFTGLVARDEIWQHVSRFDVALQPDVTEYASPLKMFEYMAAGSVIVAPDMANIREILSDDSAVFFEQGKAGFKAALTRALKEPVALRIKGQNARQALIDNAFVWERNAEKIVGIALDLGATKRN
jgi:glycosyltransferase involved in cell wall biosynthesis